MSSTFSPFRTSTPPVFSKSQFTCGRLMFFSITLLSLFTCLHIKYNSITTEIQLVRLVAYKLPLEERHDCKRIFGTSQYFAKLFCKKEKNTCLEKHALNCSEINTVHYEHEGPGG